MSDGAYDGLPDGFFDRADEAADDVFYRPERLVTHIDDHAIALVGALYAELDVTGEVVDLMSSWVSHFREAPERLTVLGLNGAELAANEGATKRVVHDLNADPSLPFDNGAFDDAVCCVSVDYLTKPIEVFREVSRVLRPGGRFVCTFSNRVFATKAIRGWLATDDAQHVQIVVEYFRRSRAFDEPTWAQCHADDHAGDPLYAVWASASP